MKLQTPVEIPVPSWHIKLGDRLLCMGSCFAENLGHLLAHHRLDTGINPYGITFNPLSLGQQLVELIADEKPKMEALFNRDDLFHHWQYHGRFSAADAEAAWQGMLEAFNAGRKRLMQANTLVLTWGSAHYYNHREKNVIVNNCHKMPGNLFSRNRASLGQIIDLWIPLTETLIRTNPDVRIVLTVSPVRYLRDGLVENNRSKATLLLAAEALANTFPDHLYYFPAYEIQIDMLRDYRFYERDMTHPTSLAIEYILDRFLDTMLKPADQLTWRSLKQLVQQLDHRPLHPDLPDHQNRIKQTELELHNLLKGLAAH
ncbi:MAG TPA: GSCFA domain-containing protein [Saprospiraceae bacterium]|nr:GSCFA domain-containing protein [Saprospiraceae bacterium]HPG07571.1 GSCFA domain-containing protein [Saprospiraceae bacterium]HRV86065.1 GSCFA domain-containing protein [Saprospiraceae bacterium]